ncbi:hypothetical protein PISL3812_05482 [Talaromyces islandicus]|uniref:Enoyl reductase (ER) domain-containing protein n=1 Tax=Talaromyces islandicus TaxID=28573 RepID=A0A0U1LZC4_TALIS|nr:hypothetical protein PISL3812_05482 [Talaromyces islandicus]
MARQWVLARQEGFETSLEYQQNVSVPSGSELGPKEVLVRLHAASLNYRELMIAQPGSVNGPITPPVIPGCDGAGVVEAVGSAVQDFHPGDRVVTHVGPQFVAANGDDALPSIADAFVMLGQGDNGTLRSKGVFSEKALVHAPKSLSWLPAATLTCTWASAWNALFGVQGKEPGPGKWVLVQGTGGVSIAAMQLAVAAGATVVATTSTQDRAIRLKAYGAAHTISYVEQPRDWGHAARTLTPNGRGFDIVVDVGGNQTLPQSLAAVRVDGVVVLAGGVGQASDPAPLFLAFMHTCIVRGILASSRSQFQELVRFIDKKKIVPAVDDVVFELAQTKDAYRRLQAKEHFAKVVIRIDH